MKVISFYMNEQTENGAARLAKECDKYGLAHEFEYVPDHGSFQANRQHVPSWILWKLLDDPSQSVVWLNATATIAKDPALLKAPGDVDLMALKVGDFFWAKTLYVRNCDASRKMLRRWADLNMEYPARISCENLTRAIGEIKPTLSILPPTYSWLEDSFPKSYGKQDPVILHPVGGL